NRDDSSRFDVYILDLQSRERKRPEPRLLAKGPGGYYSAAGWSPDDRSILVERVDSNVNQDLFIIKVATGKVRHLTPHEGDVQFQSPVWSHDGNKVYCVSTHGGRDLTQFAEIEVGTGEIEFLQGVRHEVEHVVASQKGAYVFMFDNVDGRSRVRWRVRRDG